MQPDPRRDTAPRSTVGGGATSESLTGRDTEQPTALGWLTAELDAIEDKLRAAKLTIAARGIVPAPAVRSAAVQLVALDAALADDLALVHAMRTDPGTPG